MTVDTHDYYADGCDLHQLAADIVHDQAVLLAEERALVTAVRLGDELAVRRLRDTEGER